MLLYSNIGDLAGKDMRSTGEIFNQSNLDDINESFFMVQRGEIYDSAISHVERMLIEKALEHSSGNQVLAAKILGLNRNTLRAKIKKLNINKERFRR